MTRVSEAIGREGELARLEAALVRAAGAGVASGGLTIVVVQGEAGIGKSHLVRAFLARAAAAGHAVGLGRFFDDTLDEGFAAWREAMGGVVGAAPWPAGGTRAQVVARELERVRVASERAPIVLAFDDVQWADADTLALLRQLTRRPAGARAVMVLVRRVPEALAPGVDELLAEAVRGEAETIGLAGLAHDATRRYLEALAERAIPDGLTTSLRAETAGNPLFLREAMRHLVERGAVIARADGLRVGESLDELGVPPGVSAIITPRVARLGAARRVVELLAGRADGSTVAPLARAAGIDEGAALEALEAARRAGLVDVARAPSAAGSSAARWRFLHELVRRAVWDGLAPAERMEVHRRVAEALVLDMGDGDGAAAEIAQHYRGAGGAFADKGVPHALAAARRAGAAGAVDARVALARLARTLAGHAAAEARVEAAVEVARAEVRALDLTPALASAWLALERMAEAGVAGPRRAAFIAEIARELKLSGLAPLGWRPLVERGLALVGDEGGLVRDRLAILLDDMRTLLVGRVHVAVWMGADAAAVARLRAEGDEHDVALTVDTHESRTPDESEALSRRARTFAEPEAALRILDVVARDAFFRDGDMARAYALALEVKERAVRARSLRYEVASEVVIACAAACMGRLDEAAAAMHNASEAGQRLGQRHRLHTIGPLATRLVMAYTAGAGRETWEGLARDVDQILRDPATLESPFGNVALNLSVVAFALAGRPAESLELAGLALAATRKNPRPYTETGAMRDCVVLGAWESDAPPAHVQALAAFVWPAGASERASFSCRALSEARLAGMAAAHEGRLRRDAVAASFAAAYAELGAGSQHAIAAIARLDEARLVLRVDVGAGLALLADARARLERFAMHGWVARADVLRAGVEGAAAPLPGGLTAREAELLGWLARGLANKEIAAKLFISVATVERHVANIYDKIGCRSRAAATAWALARGLGGTPQGGG